MAKPPFAVGDRYSSVCEPINSNRRKGRFLNAEVVECRLSESDGPICETISTAIRWLTTRVVSQRIAVDIDHGSRTYRTAWPVSYTRKCQAIAKQPCLVKTTDVIPQYGWDLHVGGPLGLYIHVYS